ncbi:MAG: DUF6051 family protein [Paludibacter sp.]|nr:DUF6051 family protein [Paludibacter sp.]
MNYNERYQELESKFMLGKDSVLEDSKISIQFFPFTSTDSNQEERKNEFSVFDDHVCENEHFQYPVFTFLQYNKHKNAILLLHGLNERYWNKYLTWAEYLCLKTGKPVILFPIAYHINRSPLSWTNPRILKSIIDMRREKNGEDRSLSYANIAFSERISENPRRFYNSGRQSIDDITALLTDIKSGKHPLFDENTHIDVFAYSIGAFLSQIAFMVNPMNLFSDSKLFMFCGGGIFSEMFGQSRSIMDKMAYEKLYKYYAEEFAVEKESLIPYDKALEAFNSMLNPLNNTKERFGFFEKMKHRMAGISLKRDKVIPYHGVIEAVGAQAAKQIELNDYDYDYTHENPFPILKKDKLHVVNEAFNNIFSKAACFLA